MDSNQTNGDEELLVPRDFSALKGLTYNFTDEEWAALDDEILGNANSTSEGD